MSLRLQKRLAASVLGCGLGKVWLDPNEVSEISMANSREYASRDGRSSAGEAGCHQQPAAPAWRRGSAEQVSAWLCCAYPQHRQHAGCQGGACRRHGKGCLLRSAPMPWKLGAVVAVTDRKAAEAAGCRRRLCAAHTGEAADAMPCCMPCGAPCVRRPKHPQADQGRVRDPQAAEDPLARARRAQRGGQGQGSPLRLR